MRVAVVVSRFPVLSETFVLNQITGLLDRGFEVTIHALKVPTDQVLPPELHRYDLDARCMYATPDQRRSWNIVRAVLALLLLTARSPTAVLRHLVRVARLGPSSAGQTLRLARTFSGAAPDAVLAHFGPVGESAAVALGLAAIRAPLHVVFHGYDLSRRSVVEAADYPWLFGRAESLLPVTEHWRRRLLELGAPPERTRVHRMGIDVTAFEVVPDRSEGSAVRAVSVCRLVEKKGIADGIRAVALARTKGVDVRYDVLGDGPLRSELEALAHELDVADVVAFAGWALPDQIRSVLAQADVLLAPSVTDSDGDQEGLPVSIMEGMGASLPVVSTRHTGIPELVEHGVTGFLAGERQPQVLADTLQQLTDPHLRVRMGRAGREKLLELHDVVALNDRLAALLGGA